MVSLGFPHDQIGYFDNGRIPQGGRHVSVLWIWYIWKFRLLYAGVFLQPDLRIKERC